MKINDPIFGKLTYAYVWTREDELAFWGKRNQITLMVDGDEYSGFDQNQYVAYQTFLEKRDELQYDVLQSILYYYQKKRHELGYDIATHSAYPAIETVEEMMNKITLEAISIPYGDIYEERDIGLLFTCIWDPENGVGVRLLNETVAEVGYQDIVI